MHSGITTPCMAMRLVVATTEATDPTRNCAPFRTTANVSDFSMMGVRGAVRGVTEEVRVGEIVHQFSPRLGTPLSLGPRVRITWRRR